MAGLRVTATLVELRRQRDLLQRLVPLLEEFESLQGSTYAALPPQKLVEGRVVSGGKKGQRAAPLANLILNTLQTGPLDCHGLMGRMMEAGWQTNAKNPYHTVYGAAKLMVKKGELAQEGKLFRLALASMKGEEQPDLLPAPEQTVEAAPEAEPTTPPAETNERQATTADIVLAVITEAKRPLRSEEIVVGAQAKGWVTASATPRNVIGQALNAMKHQKRVKKWGTGSDTTWGLPGWHTMVKAAQRFAEHAEA
jgi:hypothetical protein